MIVGGSQEPPLRKAELSPWRAGRATDHEIERQSLDARWRRLARKRLEEELGALGRLDARASIRPDEPVELAVDLRHLHFFDLGSGEAIGA